MNKASKEQIHSDLEAIEACLETINISAERTLCEKAIYKCTMAIRNHCDNIRYEINGGV